MNEQNGDAGRVLVVDDEASITDLLSMALRYEKFTVLAAHSGHEALDAVPGFAPDLVVLDIMMPGIDGIEVCRRIDHTRIKVVMLSARDDADTRERAAKAGADAYLTKPFSAIELLDAVEKLAP